MKKLNLYDSFKKYSGYDWTIPYYTVQDINSKNYFRIRKNPHSRLLQAHFKHEKIIALPSFYNSNVLKIDIDNKSNIHCPKSIVKQIIQQFNDSCIIEYSPYTESYHLFYTMKNIITNNCKKQIENYFKREFNYIIEVKKTNENLKLPFSKFYPICGIYDETDKNLVSSLLSTNYDYKLNLEKLTTMFRFQKDFYLPNKFQKFNKLGISIKHNKYKNNSNNFNILSFKCLDDLINDYLIKKYAYGNGTRFKTQYQLAHFCLKYNINYEDYTYICEKCNIYNSKDMKNPLIKMKKIKEAWVYASKKSENNQESTSFSYNHTSYIKQSFKLSDNEIIKLKAILNIHIDKNKLVKYKKNKDRILNDCLSLYQEVLGRYHYNKKNDIKYSNNEFLTFNKNSAICLGNELLKLVGRSLELQNIVFLKKLLTQSGLLLELTDDNGFSYSYKKNLFSKHFKLSNLFKVFLLFIKSLKSSSSNISKYLLILINYVNKIEREKSWEMKLKSLQLE